SSSSSSSCPVPARDTSNDDSDAYTGTAHCSGPQCCHCGWRGSHSPTCPFK
ncbi:hypothetical protein FIBSPDRAFT_669306, partial [Athelia psychrophila]